MFVIWDSARTALIASVSNYEVIPGLIKNGVPRAGDSGRFTLIQHFVLISLAKSKPELLQRDEFSTPDHQVIQHIDIEQLAGLNNGPGDGNIIRAGRGITAGVVVGDDDRCRVAPHRAFEQLTNPDLG